MDDKKQHGGKRPNAGRKKGTIKVQQIVRQIQVNIDTFNQLKKLKKQNKSKSWNALFAYLMDNVSQS